MPASMARKAAASIIHAVLLCIGLIFSWISIRKMDATLWITLLFVAWHVAGPYGQNVTSQFCCVSVPWHCIPFEQMCDGKIDCTGDGSDEQRCGVPYSQQFPIMGLGVTPRPNFLPRGVQFWTTTIPVENSMHRPPFMMVPGGPRPNPMPPVNWFGPGRSLPAFMSNPFPYHNVHIQENIPFVHSPWLPAAPKDEGFRYEAFLTTPLETAATAPSVSTTTEIPFGHATTTPAQAESLKDYDRTTTTTKDPLENIHISEHVDIAADVDAGFFGVRNSSVYDFVERKNLPVFRNMSFDSFNSLPTQFRAENTSVYDFVERNRPPKHENSSFKAIERLPRQFKTATTQSWTTLATVTPSSKAPDWSNREAELMERFLDESEIFFMPLAANGTGDEPKNVMLRKRVEQAPYWREFLGFRPDLCTNKTGRLPAPHCLYYFFCHEDYAAAGKCPAGMVFNPAISNCDWPRKVPQCSMN